jgi:hypothetical protein
MTASQKSLGRIFLTGCTIVTLLAPTSRFAKAQEFAPLQDYLALPADRQVTHYPLIRCAGLHRGLLDYVGASMPSATQRQAQDVVTFMVRVAVFIRMGETVGDVDGVVASVVNAVDRIVAFYRTRVQANSDRTGEAWGSDRLVRSDLSLCQTIAAGASTRFPQLAR